MHSQNVAKAHKASILVHPRAPKAEKNRNATASDITESKSPMRARMQVQVRNANLKNVTSKWATRPNPQIFPGTSGLCEKR